MEQPTKEYTKIGYKGNLYEIRFIDGRYFVKGLEGAYTSRARVYEALEAKLENEHKKEMLNQLKELRKEPNSKSKSMKVTNIRREDAEWQELHKRDIVEVEQ